MERVPQWLTVPSGHYKVSALNAVKVAHLFVLNIYCKAAATAATAVKAIFQNVAKWQRFKFSATQSDSV